MRGLFIVGTDTGVGKTTVGTGLLRLAHRRGFRLVPFKPVETGCDPRPSDSDLLLRASCLQDLTVADVCPFAFATPVAPSQAARLAGRPVSQDALLSRANNLLHLGDALLVEGAGGLLSPYGAGITPASLAVLFDMPVLLVAANRLGTINHTALSVAELKRRHIRLAGIVLVDVSTNPETLPMLNSREIHSSTGIPPLGTLRHCPTRDADAIADALVADIALAHLLDGVLA